MFSLSDGEEIMTLAFFVLIQYRSVTDRQTYRQTDILPLAIAPVSKQALFIRDLLLIGCCTLSGDSALLVGYGKPTLL